MAESEGGRPAPFAPVVIDPAAAPEEPETFEVFRIGDRSFRAPVRTTARMALRAMVAGETTGVSGVGHYLVRDALGDEAMRALAECPGVTSDQIREIIGNLGRLYLGQVEGEVLGNSDGDSPR